MFEVVGLVVVVVVGFREKKTASDVNVLFSTLLVCASLSALCQLTLNDKSYGFKDARVKMFCFPQLVTHL